MAGRVFFLGAGASADAGVPLTEALLARVARLSRNAGNLLPLARYISQFDFARSLEQRRPPIVDAVSLLESCLREERPLDSYFTVPMLRKVRWQLVLQLARVLVPRRGIGSPVIVPADARDQLGWRQLRLALYWRRFVRQLRSRDRTVRAGLLGDGDAIITTNYDTDIDIALYERAYLQEVDRNIYDVFLGSDFRDPYSDVDALTETARVVDLFKLHGSLNWLYCPRCGRIYVAAFSASVRYLVHRDRNERTCHCNHRPLEPVIIAPSVHQQVSNPHLQAIWMHAYNVLEQSAEWVFVGYTLPPEDLAVRMMLYRAANATYRRGELRIRIICLRGDVRRLRGRFEGLFGRRPVVVHGQRFAHYVKRMT